MATRIHQRLRGLQLQVEAVLPGTAGLESVATMAGVGPRRESVISSFTPSLLKPE